MICLFEKEPAALYALHYGLSPEAAQAAYHARCAELERGSEYEIQGQRYRASGRIDAMLQHEYVSGIVAPLWAVVEIV